MSFYIAMDAGGTKINAMMFDENMNLLTRAMAGGVNLSQTSLADCTANVASALDQLFVGGTPDQIDVVYCTFIGPKEVFKQEILKRTVVRELIFHSETEAGLLAGNVKREGILALAGTGGGAYGIKGGKGCSIGGLGPYVGDDGSGVWIGQQATRAIARCLMGWEKPTLMLDYIREDWGVDGVWDIVNAVQSAPAPFRKMGSLTRVVGRAAADGDELALSILREAGHLMAIQTITNIKKYWQELPEVTLCGGAWKAHPEMFEQFKRELKAVYPEIEPRRPLFEHVCAGPVLHLLNKGYSRAETIEIMLRQFPDYRIDMSGRL